jgi:arginine exporter protein ArgO
MDLQNAFYIIGIVFMGIIFLLMLGIFIAVLVIKSKINKVHRMIDQKIGAVRDVTDRASTIFRTIRDLAKHS